MSDERFRVVVDPDSCMGHGRCYDLHPDVFAPDDEGYAVLVAEEWGPEMRKQAEDAVNECPERAISIVPVN